MTEITRKTNIRKQATLMVATILFGISLTMQPARAQDKEKSDQPADTSPASKAKPVQPFRLDFAFNELEDGKIINTRRYSMNVTGGTSDDIKIGTRVPVASGSGQFQYLDVGTSISAQLREHGDEYELVVRSDVSNIDVPAHVDTANFRVMDQPVIRQIRIEGNSLLVLGKPILVGSMDDPNSKRQFQLEVTATKLR